MKLIRLAMIANLAFCGASVPALAQTTGGAEPSQWVFHSTRSGQPGDKSLSFTITQARNGWAVGGSAVDTGSYQVKTCTISGTYFPETGRFKGKCVYSNGASDVVEGYRNQDGTGFLVHLGSEYYQTKLYQSKLSQDEGWFRKPMPGKAGPPKRPCTPDEAAAFEKIAGSYKWYRMHLTIGGSCEEVTGTYRVAEWCEGVDEKGNPQTERTNGSFKGRMESSALSIKSWSQDATKNHPTNNEGTGSCTFSDDGKVIKIHCSGFGCPGNPGDLKKQ